MKRCNKCMSTFSDDVNFCPNCGSDFLSEVPEAEQASTDDNLPATCQYCHAVITDSESQFCPNCGKPVSNAQKGKAVFNKVKDNAFVKSVKSDIDNSETINMVKNKAGAVTATTSRMDASKKKKLAIIGIVVAVLIVVLVVVTHIHTCEECDKVYFGNKHTISYWGESENVCKDCYDDFYSWNY